MIYKVPATLSRLTGGFDASGGRSLATGVAIRVIVIEMNHSVARVGGSDTSESHESAGALVVYLKPKDTVSVGDKIELGGMTFRVILVKPVYTLLGKINHREVRGEPWN